MYQGVGIINGIGVSGDKEGWDQNYFMYQGESITYEGIKISLFQTSFFPLLTHVYFLPPEVEVAPSFVQVVPALTAAIAKRWECRAKIQRDF